MVLSRQECLYLRREDCNPVPGRGISFEEKNVPLIITTHLSTYRLTQAIPLRTDADGFARKSCFQAGSFSGEVFCS